MVQEGVEAVQDGTLVAYIGDLPTSTHYTMQNPCMVSVLKNVYGPFMIGFGLPKNHVLGPLFDDAIKTFQADGTSLEAVLS